MNDLSVNASTTCTFSIPCRLKGSVVRTEKNGQHNTHDNKGGFSHFREGFKNGEKTKALWDKSPLDNIPLDKSPLLNLARWAKAHFKKKGLCLFF